MQVAAECGKTFTLSEVKDIMRETAIRDSWVTEGTNASHFGNGKIDALAGIKYILEHYHNPLNGDVNHDGKVSIEDVTAIISHLLNPDRLVCPTCSDVNFDGKVSIEDVTGVINLLLGLN